MKQGLFNHHRYPAGIQQALLALGLDSLKPSFSLLLALLIALTCRNTVPWPLLAGWLALAAASTLAGHLYCRTWRQRLRQTLDPATLRRAELQGLCYGATVAVVWGSCSLLMQPQYPNQSLLIGMIYFGVCAGAATLSVMGRAHMLIGSLIGYGLFVVNLPGVFPQFWAGLALMTACYHLVLLISAWQRIDMVARNLMLTREQERLIESQRQEAERANQANQAKSAFLAAASHDLRQPVHAIMLLGHALHMKVEPGEARQLVERMLDAGKALSDQFNSLMDLSRLDSGSWPLSASTLPLQQFLARKLDALAGLAASRQVRLRLRIARNLAEQQLSTDFSLLNRIVDNLLDNAIKFSPDGGHVLLRARLRQGRLQLSVHDQGPGIAMADREAIFQPYVQLGNPTRDRRHGMGLGLSIVSRAAALLETRVGVQSAPGRGSCFTLSLPAGALSPFPAAAGVPAAHPAPVTAPAGTLAGVRLLIVEDDHMVATALRTWAGSHAMQVEHHADPRTVPSPPVADIILCDIRLPGGRDGIDWLGDWLADCPDAAGLLVSGEISESVQERAEQEGLLLLDKPVNPDLLLQTLVRIRRRPSP